MRSESKEDIIVTGVTMYSPVQVRVRCGRIVSIETISPKGPWSIMDYADLPDVSGLQVGAPAPREVLENAQLGSQITELLRGSK